MEIANLSSMSEDSKHIKIGVTVSDSLGHSCRPCVDLMFQNIRNNMKSSNYCLWPLLGNVWSSSAQGLYQVQRVPFRLFSEVSLIL